MRQICVLHTAVSNSFLCCPQFLCSQFLFNIHEATELIVHTISTISTVSLPLSLSLSPARLSPSSNRSIKRTVSPLRVLNFFLQTMKSVSTTSEWPTYSIFTCLLQVLHQNQHGQSEHVQDCNSRHDEQLRTPTWSAEPKNSVAFIVITLNKSINSLYTTIYWTALVKSILNIPIHQFFIPGLRIWSAVPSVKFYLLLLMKVVYTFSQDWQPYNYSRSCFCPTDIQECKKPLPSQHINYLKTQMTQLVNVTPSSQTRQTFD